VAIAWTFAVAWLGGGNLLFAATANSLSASPLSQDITRFVMEHPEASLRKVVEFANQRLQEVGMNFLFDAHTDPKDKAVSISAGGRELSADVSEEGACGERFASIPAVRVTKSRIDLPQNGKIVAAQRPASLRLDSMQVLSPDLQSVLADVEVPSETFPHGVTAAGSILLELPLGSGAAEWWSHRRAESKAKYFEGESPYLLFEMVAGAPRFAQNEALYVPDTEPLANGPKDPKNAYARYWKSKTTHLVVRFSAPCT